MEDKISADLYRALSVDKDAEVIHLCSNVLDGPLHVMTIQNDTVLHIAIYMKKFQLAKELLNRLPVDSLGKLTHANDWGNTLLHNAATSNQGSEISRKLLQKAPQLLIARNNWGETAIFQASRYGKTNMYEFLAGELDDYLKCQESFDHLHFFQRDDKTTILHMSILTGKLDMALMIAKRYPDLCNVRTQNGITALQILACSPAAFESGTKRGVLNKFIYRRVAVNEGQSPANVPVRSLSTIQKACSFILDSGKLQFLLPMLEDIRVEKKCHQNALHLAKILVRNDFSWKDSFKPRGEENPNIMGNAYTVDVSAADPSRETLQARGTQGSRLKVANDVDTSGGDDSHESDNDETNSKRAIYKSSISNTDEPPLLLAARKGCIEIIEEILNVFPQAVHYLNRDRQNLLHVAVRNRNVNVVELVKEKQLHFRGLVRLLDGRGNSILHMVASKQEAVVDAKMRSPALRLSKDLLLLEDMKDLCPTYLVNHHNDQMMTADELFAVNNEKLRNEAKEWLKRTAEHCTVVIVLIASVAFSAAYTVPGGPNQENGFPILLGQSFFLVFTLTDVLSLTFALTAVVIFLAILTSSFHLRDFRRSLPNKLWLGFTFLFLSVCMMVVSFAANVVLMIHNKKHWAKFVIYAVAFFPVSIFVLSYVPLYLQLIKTFIRCIQKICKSVRRQSCAKLASRLPTPVKKQGLSTGDAAPFSGANDHGDFSVV